MRYSASAVAAVAALCAATACAASPGAGRAGPTRTSTPSVTALPVVSARPTVPPGARVLYSAGGYLQSRSNGALLIFVRREVSPSGKQSTRVSYERTSACVDDQEGFVNCPVLWEKAYTVPNSSLTIDPLLRSAEFRDTLQGKRVYATWSAYGSPRVLLNENGNVFSEAWDATLEGRWGSWHHKDPANPSPPALLSRRVPKG